MKTKKYLIFSLSACSLLGLSLFFSSQSRAFDYTLTQQIGPILVDICPNIDGIQTELPDGMQFNDDGDCYTPIPDPVDPVEPPPPDPPDLCLNIIGNQTTLPDNHYRTDAGDCFVQPKPPAKPIDICSNLPGVQSAVPSGQYLTPEGTCLTPPPPPDECPNIPGPQAVIPDGMIREEDRCYTPYTTYQPSTTNPGEPAPDNQPIYKNVPPVLSWLVEPLVNAVPKPMQKWLKSLPESTAQTVPYYIFIILGLMAIIPIMQSLREATFARSLLAILRRERNIAEQKDNFIALASHYMRTPLTLMKNGFDIIISQNELPANILTPLNDALTDLSMRIEKTLASIQQGDTLKSITAPEKISLPSTLRSAFFWGPIIASLILALLSNFLLGVVGDKEIGNFNMLMQLVVAVAVIYIFYLSIRNLYLQRRLKAQNESLIDHEKAIDEARNKFISESTTTLRNGLGSINRSRSLIDGAPSAEFFNEGYNRLQAILAKFLLLTEIQTGTDRDVEEFDVHDAVDSAIRKYQTAAGQKQVQITNNVPRLVISQNRNLFEFVVESLIDNGIKFNQAHGSITLDAKAGGETLSVKVTDTGVGINKEKISQLFKPFSRAESAVKFNYEGLGFSLFLDKIIMDYTGGSIVARSEPNHGTGVTITTPLPTPTIN